MRTYGRIAGEGWVEVSSNPVSGDSEVWLTTLCQTLLLVLGESPFHANYGIPAQQSVVQQIHPDYYVQVTQAQFAPYFADLQITAVPDAPEPFYRVDVLTFVGDRLTRRVPI